MYQVKHLFEQGRSSPLHEHIEYQILETYHGSGELEDLRAGVNNLAKIVALLTTRAFEAGAISKLELTEIFGIPPRHITPLAEDES